MASFPADWGREQLESLEFVDRAEDPVLYGDVGCGKTHLAIAIGMLACQRMIPVRFFTASSPVMRLRKAKDDNRLDAELKSIGRAGLVIIDELGYLDVGSAGADLLFQLISTRDEQRSTSITTNVGISGWGRVFGDDVAASAIADRVCHHCHLVKITGRSYRLKALPRDGPVSIAELGYLPIDIDVARLLFQAGADSYETRSVISASNPESGRWGDVFGDGDMAAAVIDRIVHHGRILRFHGESYRNKHPLMK